MLRVFYIFYWILFYFFWNHVFFQGAVTSLTLSADQTSAVSVDSQGMIIISDISGPQQNANTFKLNLRQQYVKQALSYPLPLTNDADMDDLSIWSTAKGINQIKPFRLNDYTIVPKSYYQDLLREICELQERMDNLKHDTGSDNY